MTAHQIHRLGRSSMIALSLMALVTVLWGYTTPRGTPAPTDEGTGAHLFQLAIVLLLPAGLLFLGTANWKEPRRIAVPLLIAGVALIAAFSALYYLEHSWLSGGR
jgi:drug/metabolite transporter (DMT)-like permease